MRVWWVGAVYRLRSCWLLWVRDEGKLIPNMGRFDFARVDSVYGRPAG